MARSGSIENIITSSGYVIRDETVLKAPVDGTLNCIAGEGERVSKNSPVARVYTGEEDEQTQIKLNAVNEQLLAYGENVSQEQYKTDDTYSTEYQTRAAVSNIVSAMKTYDMEKALSEKQRLVILLDRYKEEGEDTEYDNLLKEKEQLEQSIKGSSSEITAPISGVFSTQIDGYEDFFDTTDISKITAEVLDSADKKKAVSYDTVVRKDEPVAKIFDNFEWYYAALVDESDVMDLRINSTVSIRFTDISNDLLPATVCAINKSQDGRVVLVVSCNRYEESIYRLRKTTTEIVLGTYTGLKIPKSAIHMNENKKTGVYVLRDGVMLFKEAEVLYAGETSVIIKESTNASGVMLYDEVIVSGKNLHDGRRL